MNAQEIRQAIAHETATNERVEMIARISRKRTERKRTLSIRNARAVKYLAQGR